MRFAGLAYANLAVGWQPIRGEDCPRSTRAIDVEEEPGAYRLIAPRINREICNASTRYLELVLGEGSTMSTPRKTGTGKKRIAARTDLAEAGESDIETDINSSVGPDSSPYPSPRVRRSQSTSRVEVNEEYEANQDLKEPEDSSDEPADMAVGMVESSNEDDRNETRGKSTEEQTSTGISSVSQNDLTEIEGSDADRGDA
ncbi:hypothetical protein VPNG_05748 [Cytospora leucostoma]|uniref:Uncharacterized protein n=1 Tax=Cytospora leucostoma TaxID=1230097 RepID=A0A423X089_9PEZI|nr:hypothetical protein VPNG_05748 [Cytospora leucostoma]